MQTLMGTPSVIQHQLTGAPTNPVCAGTLLASACRGKRDGRRGFVGSSTCLTGPCITDTWPAFLQRVCVHKGMGQPYVSRDFSQAVEQPSQ